MAEAAAAEAAEAEAEASKTDSSNKETTTTDASNDTKLEIPKATPPKSEQLLSPITDPLQSREESFTTGPQGTPTHWKQAVFLLKTPIEIQRGEFPIYLLI